MQGAWSWASENGPSSGVVHEAGHQKVDLAVVCGMDSLLQWSRQEVEGDRKEGLQGIMFWGVESGWAEGGGQ